MKLELQHSRNDKALLGIYLALGNAYQSVQPDSTLHFAQKAFAIALNLTDDNSTAEAYKLTGVYFNHTAQYDSATYYSDKALVLFRKTKNETGIANALNNLGVIQNNLGHYKEAINFYNRSLALRQKNGDHKGQADCFNNIGNTNLNQGSLWESYNNFLNGLVLRQQINDLPGIANSMSNLGNVSYMLGDYKNAISYNQHGLQINRQLNDKIGIINALINIGANYFALKQYTEATTHFTEALHHAQNIKNHLSTSICMNNLAQVALQQKNYLSAIEQYNQGLNLSRNIHYTEGIATAQLGIGNVLFHMGRAKESLPHLLDAHNLATAMNARPLMSEIAKNLSDAYASIGQYEQAYRFQLLNNVYRDSLLDNNNPKKLSELQANHELSKKQNEISLLEKDKLLHEKRAKTQLFISISLTLIIGLTSLMILLLFRSRRKTKLQSMLITRQKNAQEVQAAKLTELNQLKDKTFSILSHDLRSPIASLNNTMMLLDEQLLTPQEFVFVKTELTRQLDALNLVLDNLLHWSRLQIQGQSTTHTARLPIRHITEQNINLLRAQANNKAITIENTINEQVAANGDKDQIGIVVRNLISNAIKFTPPNGLIHISALTENNHIAISVKDNGVGMTEVQISKLFVYQSHFSERGTSGEKGTGLGLLLCKDFIEQNGGQISIISAPGEGSTVRFTLPTEV